VSVPIPASTPDRPGLHHIICVVLAYLVATIAAGVGIALTILDAEINLPNTTVIGVDIIAGTALGAAIYLHANYLSQTRVLDAIDARFDNLKEDTGQIPRLASTVVDAPEIIVLKVSDQHFQEVDRESARQVLAEAQARQARHEAEAAEVSYIDRYHDMHRGPRAVPDAD
jgi:hypothetical protein